MEEIPKARYMGRGGNFHVFSPHLHVLHLPEVPKLLTFEIFLEASSCSNSRSLTQFVASIQRIRSRAENSKLLIKT